ncbi:MAG: DNA polymerase III subunit delta' [Citromicrobium sp.]|uniref:DNA polymerase III subunit delta' n=1 Tax=unclassified Citromicrobium TaxID=2630544 RepID=UPI0006C909B3|nr:MULTISPECIES: DNA polymerase III subunit delta' [unclassified Citromicrobium]KPM25595.1 DNA polymerase III subunit delta' [Citromicrobium sp. RCC1885]KPM28837.1 DNA polymerase III subunit delta' [Citromicrobium sp. RCC1878]MAO95713.1 DNA polymerase III subunit delta' [Citromicrobium sp.]OAM09613.1 DNA polymerase III subunit delta' [Citromicrobium sp. RCC1897]
MTDHHAPQWREWRAALASPRMHHAWILAGKKGLGKHDFAFAAARELVAIGRDAPVAENDPDIQLLTHLPKDDKEAKKAEKGEAFETKRNISIDQIRAMQARLTTRPTLGAFRAIIIEPADDLERNAANALLKSLEEPPAGTFFLLVTHRPGLLLPTIRSRARILRFNPLSMGAVEDALRAAGDHADPAEIALAARASGGAPGAALSFIAQDLAPAEALMRQIASEGDPAFVLRGKLGEEIGARPDRARLSATLDLARTVLAQKLESPDSIDIPALVDAHARLVTISGQARSYNFDPGFLAMEIGTLLASAAPNRATSDG